jgi:TRAP-type C4-dicarboxylate transport system substrate-binding protein
MMRRISGVIVLAALAVAAASQNVSAQTKWNLAAVYPSGNYHTENLVWFADEVKKATDGKLEITVHPGAWLFKAPEIKRAVGTGQAQMGEVLISIHENEDPVYGMDTIPFLASSYAEAWKRWEAQKAHITKKLVSQGIMVLFAVPWGPHGISRRRISSPSTT